MSRIALERRGMNADGTLQTITHDICVIRLANWEQTEFILLQIIFRRYVFSRPVRHRHYISEAQS